MSTIPNQATSKSPVHFSVQKKCLKFTDLTLSSLKAPGYYRDQRLPAFGVRKGTRRVCFIVVRDGRRKKLGLWPAVSLQEARNHAREYLASLEPGAPAQRRVTYGSAVEEYLRQHQGRPRTIKEYERLLTRFPIDHAPHDIRLHHVLAKTDALEHVPTERLHLHTAYRAFFNWCVCSGAGKRPRYTARGTITPEPLAKLQRA